MSLSESAREAIMDCRENEVGEDGVLDRQTRKAQIRNQSVYANLTQFAARYHGIGKSDDLEITVCEEGIWIEPGRK